MSVIAAVLFDINGVLYRYDQAARIAYLGAIASQPAVMIQAAIWQSGFEDTGDAGAMDADAYLRGFGARIGYPLTETEWLLALNAALAPIPANVGLLTRLRGDVTWALLTNNNLLVRRHFAAIFPELAQHGGHAFVSAEFGARKPDPEVYRRCAMRLGKPPDAVLFIDDRAANIEGAAEAGMATHRYADPPALEAALRAHGVLVA